MPHHRFIMLPALSAAVLAAAACGPSAEIKAKLAAYDTLSVQKDSLLQEVALQARVLSDVSSQLATVQMKELRVSSESPRAAQYDSMVQKVKLIVARVDESEKRLRESRRRVQNLTHISDSLRATLEATMANLQDVIETQKMTIATLTSQVDTLSAQNTVLTAENSALKDTVTAENTVFYVIGTKEELKSKGLLVEEGGSRVLFVLWRTGETLAPARTLDPTHFAAIDRRQTTEIPLPYENGTYRIVSRHDLNLLGTPHDARGRITGTSSLRIASPVEFWKNSKYLIVVQEQPEAAPRGTD